jgi:DNA replication protein DnaC
MILKRLCLFRHIWHVYERSRLLFDPPGNHHQCAGDYPSPSPIRFLSTVELVNQLEQAKLQGRMANRITQLATHHSPSALLLTFSRSGCALAFHLRSTRYEKTTLIIIANQCFVEWPTNFGDAKPTTTLLDRLAHQGQVLETDNGG